MTVRRILTIDNPADLAVLKQVSAPVAVVDDGVRALMDDMLETMYDAPGIGLAAVQIGELKRVVVMDLGDGEPDPEAKEGGIARRPNPCHFVNPEVLWASDELFPYEEGCLSIPEYFDEVKRPARVRVAYLDREGRRVEEDIEGLYAVCFQHELDHLDGVLLIDRQEQAGEEAFVAASRAFRREVAAFYPCWY